MTFRPDFPAPSRSDLTDTCVSGPQLADDAAEGAQELGEDLAEGAELARQAAADAAQRLQSNLEEAGESLQEQVEGLGAEIRRKGKVLSSMEYSEHVFETACTADRATTVPCASPYAGERIRRFSTLHGRVDDGGQAP